MSFDYTLKEKRKRHIAEMEQEHGHTIEICANLSKIYDNFTIGLLSRPTDARLTLKQETSTEALLSLSDKKSVAILNFASYVEAGGAYLLGGVAQEEALCDDSFLFNVLAKLPEYYRQNRLNKNRGLYTNRAVYSPSVSFFKDGKTWSANVITCAAPNFRVAHEFCGVTKEQNDMVFKDRIRFMLDVAEDNNVRHLVLGAWGCGVFGQSAETFGKLLGETLATRSYRFNKIVLAIPDREKLIAVENGLSESNRKLKHEIDL